MLGSYLKRPQLLYHGKFVLSVSSLPLSVTVHSYHACVVNLSSLPFEFLSHRHCVIACSSPFTVDLIGSSSPIEYTSSIFIILKFKRAHLKFPISGWSKCTSIDRYTHVSTMQSRSVAPQLLGQAVLLDCNLFDISISYGFQNINSLCQRVESLHGRSFGHGALSAPFYSDSTTTSCHYGCSKSSHIVLWHFLSLS